MSGPDQTPQKPNDRELEDFLAGRGPVREVYRAAAQEKSPAALDDAILKMAAQVVTEPLAPSVRRRAPRRWPMSLAAVAVMVLSLSVFVQIDRDPVAKQVVLAPQAEGSTMRDPIAAKPALPSSPPAMAQMQREQARRAEAEAEQTQRRRNNPKKEMAEADAVAALAAPAPAPAMAPQPVQETEAAAFAKDESASRAAMMQEGPRSAMSAKSLRAAPAPMPSVALAEAPPSASEIDQQMDRWLKTCVTDSELAVLSRDERGMFKTAQQWHGLPVVGFADGALLFASTVSRETVVAQLDRISPHAAGCLVPASSDNALQLRCGCSGP